jgi:hypothetical protein
VYPDELHSSRPGFSSQTWSTATQASSVQRSQEHQPYFFSVPIQDLPQSHLGSSGTFFSNDPHGSPRETQSPVPALQPTAASRLEFHGLPLAHPYQPLAGFSEHPIPQRMSRAISEFGRGSATTPRYPSRPRRTPPTSAPYMLRHPSYGVGAGQSIYQAPFSAAITTACRITLAATLGTVHASI